MPHVEIDYSESLDESHDLRAMVEALFEAIAAHPSVKGRHTVRVRARPCRHTAEGTARPGQAHATLHLIPGRDETQRAELARIVMDTLEAHLPDVGSLSVNLAAIDSAYLRRTL